MSKKKEQADEHNLNIGINFKHLGHKGRNFLVEIWIDEELVFRWFFNDIVDAKADVIDFLEKFRRLCFS